MGRLKPLALLAALLWCTPAQADNVAQWRRHIAEASRRFGVPAEWIERVMRAESAGRTHRAGRPITSRAGAMGLMQLMPGTWAEMRAAHGLGRDPFDPRDNILAGTAYLRSMYDRFGYPGAFAAYNAGPARYARYVSGAGALPRETVAYVRSITGDAGPQRPAPATEPSAPRGALPAGLFAIGPRPPGDPGASPGAGEMPSLFAIRR